MSIPILQPPTPEPADEEHIVLRPEDCADILTAAIAYVQQYEAGGNMDLRAMVRNTLIKTVHDAFDNAVMDAEAAKEDA